jgi:DNA (cytosine-5)-methyltransferase 1
MTIIKRPFRVYNSWKLTDLATIPKNGLTVFSCFHCGGGSSMGYKLAGFNVLGGVELDPEIMSIYRANHYPKHSYLMGVQQFNEIPLNDLPDELKNLDILDGSPPCSVFSMAGKREKKWGAEHHFREGQTKQKLDDLFFDFIEIGCRLQPKIIVAENVKGLIMGNAKGYVKEIFTAFREAGYDAQLFLLNSACMGVPQARERTFFIARRKDLSFSSLKLAFNEPQVPIGKAIENVVNHGKITQLTAETKKLWEKVKPGEPLSKAHPKGHRFNAYKAHPGLPSRTLAAGGDAIPMRWDQPRRFSEGELKIVQSFPNDYNFLKTEPGYVMGMSVPPFMTQRVALEIGRQWFNLEYD